MFSGRAVLLALLAILAAGPARAVPAQPLGPRASQANEVSQASEPARVSPSSIDGAELPRVAPHALVLVSLDGFRHDYLELHEAPNLARFAAEGVRAEALVPVFPTSTFPNHYTLVTGLWPEHHGIVDNTMYDPELDETFEIGDRLAVEDARWWAGEPLWVKVEKAGRVAATMFWPGSEAEIGGVRPTHWFHYDASLDEGERVATVLAWLDLPEPERPAFVTLYFSSVDSAGHRFGPRSAEVAAAVQRVDARLGELLAGLEARGIADATDVVVVSDHGMVELDRERVIVLDDLVDLDGLHVVTLSPVLGIRAAPERLDEVLASLAGAHPHLSVWPRAEVPDHLHYRVHARIPPIVGLADEGWRVLLREDLEDLERATRGATHGYDPRLRSMQAFFAARGPGFRRGLVVPPFESIHLYTLFTRLLALEPAPNDGDPEALVHLLAPPDPERESFR